MTESAPELVEVYAVRGPLAGRRLTLPAADVDAATADDGWAKKYEPGADLTLDTGAPINPKWKIPGYDNPSTPNEKTADVKAAQARTAEGKRTAPAPETKESDK